MSLSIIVLFKFINSVSVSANSFSWTFVKVEIWFNRSSVEIFESVEINIFCGEPLFSSLIQLRLVGYLAISTLISCSSLLSSVVIKLNKWNPIGVTINSLSVKEIETQLLLKTEIFSPN